MPGAAPGFVRPARECLPAYEPSAARSFPPGVAGGPLSTVVRPLVLPACAPDPRSAAPVAVALREPRSEAAASPGPFPVRSAVGGEDHVNVPDDAGRAAAVR
ncbi:hypothetical protein D5S19_19955 [Amycolatopsis panacis]|uniref:Uncharacterized protein n=1 Tax=Amycolatopsis panacis TaxID=2340917 RepID=A0A419I1G5_9PSEU|nr:hypothetical protein D5S19_19955 [Amycolatopsis panacis]